MPFPYQFEFAFEPVAEKPTIQVRIAFASDPFDASPSWTDVSSDVLEFHTSRGREYELDRMEVGTLELVLDNASGDYYPENTGGSYTPNVRTMKRVNVRGSFDAGVSYFDLYTGYVESWTPNWRGVGGNAPVMTVRCADGTKTLARLLLNDAGEAQELSGTRVGNILDTLGWDATARTISTGDTTIIASGAFANQNALEHLHQVMESELGALYVGADGYMVFEDRSRRTESPYDTAQCIFGDSSGEDKYRFVDFALDEFLLFNDVRATRSGGVEQVGSNASSKTAYGTRSLNRSGLLLTNDQVVLSYVTLLVARYGDVTKSRVKFLHIIPARDPANLLPKVLGYDLSTRIGVKLSDAGIDDEYYIEGIRHDWDARTGILETFYQLSEASRQYFTPDPIEEILRPNAAGDVTQLTPFPNGGEANWEDVDDVTPDEDATYVTQGGDSQDKYDLYNISNPSNPVGTINSVTVYMRARKTNVSALHGYIKLKTNGTLYEGDLESFTQSYDDYSKEYALNPNTIAAWQWSELNDLQIGFRGLSDAPAFNNETRCTQVYAVVNYTPSW